jgi:hypothetical protein
MLSFVVTLMVAAEGTPLMRFDALATTLTGAHEDNFDVSARRTHWTYLHIVIECGKKA